METCPKCGAELDPERTTVPERRRYECGTSKYGDIIGESVLCLRNQLTQVKAENKRLDALAVKTADGLLIEPGMVVWTQYWSSPQKGIVKDFGKTVYLKPPSIWSGDEADTDSLFAIRENALAAQIEHEADNK